MMKKLQAAIVLVGLILTIFLCHFAEAGLIAPDLGSALQGAYPGQEISVIVAFADKVDPQSLGGMKDTEKRLRRFQIVKSLREKAEATQVTLTTMLKDRGVKSTRQLWIVNALAAALPAHLIQEIAERPEIDRISLDQLVSAPSVTLGTATTSEWNIDAIRSPVLWNSGYTGQGVVVASMDTGVDVLHPDLATTWRGGTNSWYDPNGEHATPNDVNGHGTMVMGVIVGGFTGGTNIGVAPDAKWIAAKIYNDSNLTTYSIIHQVFQWLLDPDDNPATDDVPDVLNISWGIEAINNCSSEFQLDINTLKAAGVAVAIAAGNYGPASSTSISPGNYPEGFAVGAVDETLNIASFSSRGPSACDNAIYPEVVAPGVNIRTTDLTFGGVFPDSYTHVSGTSFSTPHVAGTMALLLSAFPNLTPSEMERALKDSALDLGLTGADNLYGYGLIDGLAAFTALGGVPAETVSEPSAPAGPTKIVPGTVHLFSTGGAVSSTGDQVQYLFDWGDGTDSGWLIPDTLSISKSWTSLGTYTVRARARCTVHPLVTSNWSGALGVRVSNPVTITLSSKGRFDGWVSESAKAAKVGGSVGRNQVKVGDDDKDRQYRGILSFDTSKIPVDAEILSATLKLTVKDVLGVNPFSSLGVCYVDVMKGTFGKKSLKKADFEVQATVSQVAVMSDPEANGGISAGIINVDGINAINKGGITQIRMYFSTPSNNNELADLIVFYPGEIFSKTKRPTLEITYLP